MMDNREILYCAHWKNYGQEYLERANSPGELRTKIFGQAYAPDYNKVTYFIQYKESEHV